MHHMILVFLNLLRLVLWPSMLSVLENILCVLEKNVYSTAFGYNVLYISVRVIWSHVSFKANVS